MSPEFAFLFLAASHLRESYHSLHVVLYLIKKTSVSIPSRHFGGWPLPCHAPMLALGHILPFSDTLRVLGCVTLANSSIKLKNNSLLVMLLKMTDAGVMIGGRGFTQWSRAVNQEGNKCGGLFTVCASLHRLIQIQLPT